MLGARKSQGASSTESSGIHRSFPPQDRVKAEALNLQLRKQLSEFRVPPVMAYVGEKSLHEALESAIKTWGRKVEIAEVGPRGAQDPQASVPVVFLFTILFCRLRTQVLHVSCL